MLSAPFPITSVSYRRKFIRDITGQTGYQQRKAQFLNALGPKDMAAGAARGAFLGKARSAACRQCRAVRGACRRRRVVGLSAAVAVAAADLADGHHPHPQHRRARRRARQQTIPCATPAPRSANFLERLFIAPYCVNYHLEHHLLFYVPCYNLPRVHRILMRRAACGPHGGAAELRRPCCGSRPRSRTTRTGRGSWRKRRRRAAGSGAEVGADQTAGGLLGNGLTGC